MERHQYRLTHTLLAVVVWLASAVVLGAIATVVALAYVVAYLAGRPLR